MTTSPSDQKIALVEVFPSLQGEGYHSGRSAVFVRSAGCNLSCVFGPGAVCDTPYQQANHKVTIEELFREHVFPLVQDVPKKPRWTGVRRPAWEEDRTMLILTGGEPTMQPLFDDIVTAGVELGFYVAVETNGTRWREGLRHCDWICVSPKESIVQGSPAPHHNHNPQNPTLDPMVMAWLEAMAHLPRSEYRYVLTQNDAPPPWHGAFRHYLSPAVLSDGSGLEWKVGGFPGFAPGALERCMELVRLDPRWRLSAQQHKWWGVR